MFRGEQPIEYESTLERDFIYRTEFFIHVLDVIPQPVSIEFKAGNGRIRTYTPDFLVYFRLGNREYPTYPKPMLVEVKPRDEWKRHWRAWSPKWKAAITHAKQEDWYFRIKDESRIRDQALANIQWLRRFKRTQLDPCLTDEILEDLWQLGSAQASLLVSRHFGNHQCLDGFRHIWALLAQRHLQCDISRAPLHGSTELWVATDE